MLTAEELSRQLVEWNDTEVTFPSDRCVHELFAGQAARTPHAIAVSDNRGAISYADHDAPMEIFLTSEGIRYSGSPTFGWETIHKGPLLVHEVSGQHVTMVKEPHVLVLAEILSESLRRAQSQSDHVAVTPQGNRHRSRE